MAIEIKKLDNNTLSVNGKEVILDMDGKWICHEIMSGDEVRAFKHHIKQSEG